MVAIKLALYDQIGGQASIEKVVDYFYQLILADETVNQFFKHTDIEKQKKHQTKFISYALGGPNQYTGKSMAKAHGGLNLQPVHYDAIVKHLNDALAHFDVAESDRQQVMAHVGMLKDDILYK